jgi:hypothetical protein
VSGAGTAMLSLGLAMAAIGMKQKLPPITRAGLIIAGVASALILADTFAMP